jgi:hypothetical protein
MITIHDNTDRTQAQHVLARFNELVRKASKNFNCSLSVEAYENGREHGYYIETWRQAPRTDIWAVAFSEYRNCDDIVVYVGKAVDFEKEGHVPTEAVWSTAKSFKAGDFDGTAAFIFGYLVDMKEHKR